MTTIMLINSFSFESGPQSEICLGCMYMSFSGIQIRIPRGQIGNTLAFAYVQTRSFSAFARACARGCVPKNKKAVASARVVKKTRAFFSHLFTQIASHEQP
jgi:hypothetical protein